MVSGRVPQSHGVGVHGALTSIVYAPGPPPMTTFEPVPPGGAVQFPTRVDTAVCALLEVGRSSPAASARATSGRSVRLRIWFMLMILLEEERGPGTPTHPRATALRPPSLGDLPRAEQAASLTPAPAA